MTTHGIFLLDKPLGISSNLALQKVKRLFKVKKAGHTGSLDPDASGMLPICFGEATKFSQYLLEADKCYEVTGLLGIKTNTGDASGEIIQQVNNFVISNAQLQAVLPQFIGSIKQIPSMFSALKFQGRPLYSYARSGVEIERQPRDITINSLELKDFDGECIQLVVRCSKGTYIRNLIEDLGDALGVGAHVTQLHRRYTAGFELDPIHSLEALQQLSTVELQNLVLPLDRPLMHLPALNISSQDALFLYQGKLISQIDSQIIGKVRLYENNTRFIGLGDVSANQQLRSVRLLSEEYKKGRIT